MARAAPAGTAARLTMTSKGWFEFGRIMHSADTLVDKYDYNGNWIQSVGAQFTLHARISDHWTGSMGLGGRQIHPGQGGVQSAQEIKSIGFAPYITQARFTYSLSHGEKPPFAVTFGLFPLQYTPDARNLGAYLFRGPVYPGFLFSGFEDPSVDSSIGNILGIRVFHNAGPFSHSLIVRNETDLPPVFDFSLAYLADFNAGGIVEIGAGVNFYRLIPIKRDLTQLTDEITFKVLNPSRLNHPYEALYAHVDTLVGDTTRFSHQGVKVMGRAAFDPKPLLGKTSLGPLDLRLYAEAAVIGVQNYPAVYDDITRRIPVVVGFNIPTFGLLEVMALEVEWYGAPFRNDLKKLVNQTSPIPMSNGIAEYARTADAQGRLSSDTTVAFEDPFDVTDMQKDNLKWSLYLSKVFLKKARISLQLANDHFRPNTPENNPKSDRFESAFTTREDWYMMARVGYIF